MQPMRQPMANSNNSYKGNRQSHYKANQPDEYFNQYVRKNIVPKLRQYYLRVNLDDEAGEAVEGVEIKQWTQ